jgi:HAD superfamily hydrolase (TIGR01490 family)
MRLALFDLDHTLIPFDSGLAWTRHLIKVGARDAQAEDRYLAFCHQYVAGTLDIHAMHRASMEPLAAFTPEQLHDWRAGFGRDIEPALPPDKRALVRAHLDAGDLCAIVTATSRWVAEPFAQAFGIGHLLATEAVALDGRPGPEILGPPCYREHKLTHVNAWLAGLQGMPRTLQDFERCWFYSDSISDLPLLQAVSDPVAVQPDARLRQHAIAHGWRLLEAA